MSAIENIFIVFGSLIIGFSFIMTIYYLRIAFIKNLLPIFYLILNKLVLKYCETRIKEHQYKKYLEAYHQWKEIKYYSIEYKLFNKWHKLKPYMLYRYNKQINLFYSKYCVNLYLNEPRKKLLESYKGQNIYLEQIYYSYHDYYISDIEQIRIEIKYKVGKYVYDSLESAKQKIDDTINYSDKLKTQLI